MNTAISKNTALHYVASVTIILSFANSGHTQPEHYPYTLAEAGHESSISSPKKPTNAWAIAFENDVLVGGNRDKDYTYGLSLSFRGNKAESFLINPYPMQRAFENIFWPQDTESQDQGYDFLDEEILSLEFGIYSFTPDDIEIDQVINDDRPYASLIYLESSKERINPLANTSWTSSLSIGLLGTNLAGSAQNSVHKITGSKKANGWRNQISDGGELTAKYTLARQKIIGQHSANVEIKTTSQIAIGYLTEFSYGVSFRLGKIHSAWWSFDPDLASYGERSNNSAFYSKVREHYAWGGFTLKYRAYNAFLQGQFRDSDHQFSSNKLNHNLVEAWLGYTLNFNHGYRISYYIRGHSSEIKKGKGNRNLVWGGLIFSKSL
ncbi:lipid A deacylase LpxR family protein [Aurantivibrio infirmus]